MGTLLKTSKLFDGNIEAMVEEQNARSYITSAFANFEQVISSIRGRIEVRLLRSGVFDKLSKLVENGGNLFSNFIERMVTILEPKIQSFINSFTTFFDQLTTAEDPGQVIKDKINEILNDIQTKLIDPLFKEIGDRLKDGLTTIFDNTVKFLKDAATNLGGFVSSMFESKNEKGETTGGFSETTKMIIGGSIGAVGVAAAAAAISTLTGGIGALLVGLGLAAYALKEFSVADQIEKLANLPPDALTKAAEGVERLKDAIESFTPGIMKSVMQSISDMVGPNTIGKLSEMADAGVKVNYLAEALQKVDFNKLDVSGVSFDKIEVGTKKIEALSSKLAGLKKSMDEVSTPSLAATLGDSLKKITVAIEEALPDTSESNKQQKAELANLGNKLEQLNANVAELVRVQREALDDIKKTARNTKSSNNLL
jgi:molecular chaperone GrpE (heat shock protein)